MVTPVKNKIPIVYNGGPEVDAASASTTDIGAVFSNNVRITGTTTINSFGTSIAGTIIKGRFTGILTLTYNATSMILPTGANIVTAVNDTFEAFSLGSGNWQVTSYQRANGQPLTHQTIDQLVHNMAETSFVEALPVDSLTPTSITIWTDSGKTIKRYEELITYSGNLVTQIIARRYDGTTNNVAVGQTITTVPAYGATNIVNTLTNTLS